MEDFAADFIINNEQPLELEAEISEGNNFDCIFEIFAAGTTWGNIAGDISNQTDLKNALDAKADISEVESVTGALADSIQAVDNKYDSITSGLDDSITAIDNKYDSITGALDDKIDSINGALSSDIDALESITGGLSDSISAIDSTIGGYGDIVTYNAADFADSAQGALADTALQPNDNISELVNDVGYITSAALPTVNNSSIVFQKNGTGFDTITLNQASDDTINISIPTQASDINALPDSTTINDLTTTAQQNALNSGATSTNIGQIATNTQAISDETTARENADIGLQQQIDAIVSSSDVYDIVGTYAELQAYDISTVPVNDIIKVLVDSTHNDAATYYRCTESGGVKSWTYIGSEGAYYTKGEADSTFVPQTRTINNKALSSNITLDASDVGALPDSTVIPAAQVNSDWNAVSGVAEILNKPTIPTDTSDLTNGAGYITSAALSSYVDLSSDQNITGTKTFVGQKKIGFKQSGSSDKLGFTLYNNSGTEKGYLEYNPSNTVDSVPLMTLGNYATASGGLTHVGFRKYSSISGASGAYNLLTPLISDAKTPFNLTTTYTNFYFPLGFTDGNTTVLTAKSGVVDLSSLLPTVPTNISAFTNDSGYITSSALNGYATETWVTNKGYAVASSLATVATSGSYNDLSNKPTIPTVNNATLTIQKNGTTVKTFTANASSDVTCNITVPTNTNELTNGAGFVTTDTKNTAGSTDTSSKIFLVGATSQATSATTYSHDTVFVDTSGQLNSTNPSANTNSTVVATTKWVIDKGYTSNVGTVTSVNNTQPDANGNVNVTASGGANIDLSNLSATGEAHFQAPLVSGTNIKTVNNTSLLGSGNIDTSEILFAQYGTTTTNQISQALASGKAIFCIKSVSSVDYIYCYSGTATFEGRSAYTFSRVHENTTEVVYVSFTTNEWNTITKTLANDNLSNVSSIDSGSAVQTALDGKVNKAGDTMTGSLNIQCSNNLGVYLSHSDVTKGTNPSATKYWQVIANDSSNGSTWQSTRLGFLEWSLDTSGTTYMNLAAIENTADSSNRAQLTLSRTQAGVSSATINCALTVQSTINTAGNITITKNGTSQFYAKNSGFNYTSTASTATTIGQFYALDTNGKVCGGLSVNHTDANAATTAMVARRSISGTEKSAYLTVGVDSSGNAYATAPATPADNNNSTQIATTAFIKRATDGQWVDSSQTILDDTSITHSSSTALLKTVTLPNDGYKYEVTLRGQVTTGSTSGNYIMLTITGNEDSYGSYVCGIRTRTNSTMFARGQVTVTMSYGSNNLTIARNSAFNGTASLDVIRYRRIGKNS